MSPTCVLDAFGVDLENSIFGWFLDPRYLPCKSRISGIWDIGFGYEVPHLAFLDRNTIKIVSRTSKLNPTCVLGAFAVDLEKSIFWPIFGPKVPPLQISKIRNSGYWFWVWGTSFGVFGSKNHQNHTQNIQTKSHMRPVCICSGLWKIDFCRFLGPRYLPCKSRISGIRDIDFGYWVPHLEFPRPGWEPTGFSLCNLLRILQKIDFS